MTGARCELHPQAAAILKLAGIMALPKAEALAALDEWETEFPKLKGLAASTREAINNKP